MSNSKRNDKMTEEDFLKNKARRKGVSTKKSSKKKKAKGPGHWILLGVLIALGLALFSGIIWGISWLIDAFFEAPETKDNNNLDGAYTNSAGEDITRAESEDGKKQYYTFLATATDAGGSLTDVIMVARFNYSDEAPEVSILQIPRDTFVKVSSNKLYFNKDGTLSKENFISPTANYSIKINEAFHRGKSLAYDKITSLLEEAAGKNEKELKKLIASKDYIFIDADIEKLKKYSSGNENEKNQLEKDIRRDFGIKYLQTLIYYNFGIPTDYYAQVNINGFRGVVDAIGGVDLYVPQNMDYEDEYQDLYIHLKKGQQHLDGKKAEQFVRFRGYPGGDIARLDAQKLFVDAFFDKLVSPSTILKLDDIATEVQKNLFTDISVKNLVNFGNKAIKMDIGTDVTIQTLPGDGEYIGGVSYFIANRNETIKLINNSFNVFDSDLIPEDFCIIASENIVRPASANEDEENIENADETDDDGEDGDEEKNENDDEENGKNEEVEDSESNEDNDEVKDNDSDDETGEDSSESDEETQTGKDDESSENNVSDEDVSSEANLELLEQMLNENVQ